MARFIPSKGPQGQSDYYRDVITGELITKRQRAKILRAGLSNETYAKLNAITNLDLALSRPARGRASLLKTDETEKAFILEARKEALKRKKEIEAEQKEAKKLERLLEKQRTKKVRRSKVTHKSLIPGRKASRHAFNDYDEYLVTLKEVKALGTARAYGLGMQGYDVNSGEPRTIWVFGMRIIRDPPYTEEEFYEGMDEAQLEYSYFDLQYYFMHVAYKEEAYKAAAKKYKAEGGVIVQDKRRKSRAKKKRK